MLGLFYLNYYVLIPHLYAKNRLTLYIIVLGVGLIVVALAPSLLTGYTPWENRARKPPPERIDDHSGRPSVRNELKPTRREERDKDRSAIASFLTQVQHNIVLYVAVSLFSIFLHTRIRLFEAERLRHNAEINTLRSQINPHFLFNTLNNIYAFAIREKAHSTASTILKLSAMMRYVVTDSSRQFVSFEKEIAYTNDYIELQQMRLTSNLSLSYRVSGQVQGKVIAPLILMPFIENAFKHGVNPNREAFININIDVGQEDLELTVENQKVRIAPESHTRSGVGVENTRNRLELIYPRKYLLLINEDENQYRVRLKLTLT